MPSNQFNRVEKLTGENEKWRLVGEKDNPSFQNSWQSFGSPTREAGFFKDKFGIVHLKGGLKNGTTGTVAFQVPDDYVNGMRMNFASVDGAGNFCYIQISTSGGIRPYTSDTTYVSLDGIIWRVSEA